jgi:hypothetical protein
MTHLWLQTSSLPRVSSSQLDRLHGGWARPETTACNQESANERLIDPPPAVRSAADLGQLRERGVGGEVADRIGV